MVKVLLQLSKDLHMDLSKGTATEESLARLHIAIRNARKLIVGVLLVAGADINVADNAGIAPLYQVCRERDRDTIEYIPNLKGANIDAADKNGKMPPHTLLEYGADKVSTDTDTNVDLFQLLLSRGALLHSLENDGNKLLHVSIKL